MSKHNFQIIVPFYNDFENFLLFVNKIEELELKEKVFLLIDNGSEDNRMTEYFKSKSNILSWEVIRIDKNQGFGGGVIHASEFINKDFIGWMPGNMKLNPKEVYELFIEQNIADSNTLIKGKRINRPILDSFKTYIFGIFASIYFRTNLMDAGGTPNMVNSKFFNYKHLLAEDVSFDIYVYYFFRKLGKVLRPKISYTTRVHGKSKWQKGFISEIKMTINIFKRKKTWDRVIGEKFE